MTSSRSIRALRSAALVLVLGLTLPLAACSDEPEALPTPTVTVDPEVDADKDAVPEPELPTVWPLTGVEVKKVADRPALAVKIENTAAARPQSGLEDADVVWETIVEFQVSRFIAVYQSQIPGEVGPVRSVRPIDLRVVPPLNGLFVFSGAQAGVVRLINGASGLQPISNDDGAAGLYRVGSRRAPHNVYGSLETVLKSADSKHSEAPSEQFAFALEADKAVAVLDGKDTSLLKLTMSSASNPSWQWNAEESAWMRSERAGPAMAASGKQLSAANVVVIQAKEFNSRFKAQAGVPVPDLELEGSGKALIATGGKTVVATWEKKDDASPLTLVTKDGEPALLAPGNTWVELMPMPAGSYTTE